MNKITNFVKACFKHIKNGAKQVSNDKYTVRISICDGCQLKSPDWVCQHEDCGCFITIKAKWESEHCPLNKWPDDVGPRKGDGRINLPCTSCGKN